MKLVELLLKIKEKLPKNGDWIVPTLEFNQNPHEADVAAAYTDPQKVLAEFAGRFGTKVAEVLLSEADRFSSRAASRSDHVRDKAKILLRSASFFGAVILGVISLLAQQIQDLPDWVIWSMLVLMGMTVLQFGVSLKRSMNAIYREQVIDLSVPDLGEAFTSATDEERFSKELAAKRLAFACRQELLTTRRVNMLILGQDGFLYGLLYSLLLILTLLTGIIVTSSSKRVEEAARENALQHIDISINHLGTALEVTIPRALHDINKSLHRLNATVETTLPISTSHLMEIEKRERATSDRLSALENQVKSLSRINGSEKPQTKE